MENAAPVIDPELVGGIIAAVGTPGFGAALDAALSRVAPFDLTAILGYPDDAGPVLLHDGLRGVSGPGVMRAYLEGTYLMDAVYTACKRRIAPGLYRLAELAPDAFFEGEYYNSPLVHPCVSLESGALAEEIAYLVALPQGHHVACSLMRSHGGAPFSPAEFARLAAYVPVVSAALVRQWGAAPPAPPASIPADPDPLETAFRTFGHHLLSPREQRIVSLVLRGHSSGSIGLVLGIAEGTVKNHRKHIHAKLGISSQAELFALFLRHLQVT